MASYYRRDNGTYCVRVSNGMKNGKQEQISTTYKPPKNYSENEIKRGVKAFAELFEASVHSGIYVPGKRVKAAVNPFGMTVEAFAKEHYMKSIETRLSPNTVKFYNAVLEDIIIPSFGNIRLTDITAKHQQALVDYLASPGARTDKSNGKPLSASTVKRYATVFSSLMTEAQRMGYIEENPLRNGSVRFPKIKKEPVKAYSREEAAIFVEGLANESARTKAMLMTALLLGLRRGEVVALKWEDIDWENRAISINKSAYKKKGEPQALKPPKSVNSIREVFFSKMHKAVLLEWREEQRLERSATGEKWNEQGFVFTNAVGNMFSLYSLTTLCSDYEERCGLRHLKFHGLRHTRGSLMVSCGADLETVKAVFGHESIRTTEHYLTPYDESKRRAADMLADIVTNKEREVAC